MKWRHFYIKLFSESCLELLLNFHCSTKKSKQSLRLGLGIRKEKFSFLERIQRFRRIDACNFLLLIAYNHGFGNVALSVIIARNYLLLLSRNSSRKLPPDHPVDFENSGQIPCKDLSLWNAELWHKSNFWKSCSKSRGVLYLLQSGSSRRLQGSDI